MPTAQPAAPPPRPRLDCSERSLAIALGQLDDAISPDVARSLAEATLSITIALTAIARAGGQRLSPSCELLAQLHDLATHQVQAS